MQVRGIAGVTSSHALERHILDNGCYDKDENRRIYTKWFSGGRPRDRVFAYLDDKLGLATGSLCDVGCGYGATLVHAGPGSYGIELEDYQAAFGRSVGLSIHTRNVITDDLTDLPRVDTVWCAAMLEHVDAPHIVLRRLYYLLKPGGRIVLIVPCAPPALWIRHAPGLNRFYRDHDDHINSFSPASLARFCERAGFRELWTFRYSTPLINRLKTIPVWATRYPPFSWIAQSIVYVGRGIPDWDYPPKATRRAANNAAGYRFRSMFSRADEPLGDGRE